MMRVFVLVFIVLLLGACESEKAVKNTTINGIWESVGSGWILQIKDSSEYHFYDTTSISCIAAKQGDFKAIEAGLTLKNDTLSLLKGVITYDFVKRETFPESCKNEITEEKRNDPLYNFEVFAETVKAHYAFFELNKIQWESLYRTQKSKLSQASSDVELYRVIEETLELLNDNHAFIEATDTVYEALDQLPELEETTTADTLPEYGDFQVAGMVAAHHLQEDLTRDYHLRFH